MHRYIHKIRTGFLYVAVALLAGSAPMTALAQTPPADTTTAAPTATEPQRTYTYNDTTGRWDSDVWTYDPGAGNYVPTPVPAPAPAASNPTTSITPQSNTSPTSTGAYSPSGANEVATDAAIDSSLQVQNNASVTNNQTSNAASGNAGVIRNNQAGSATTGDATAETTIINSIHSAVQGDTAGIAHFTSDIYGNVTGDIMLYPALQNALVNSSVDINSDTDIRNNNEITNNVDLNATSGNATVEGNTSAGNATSGDAHAIANLVNLINTIIAANQSFIGTINIHGNLDGDILISPDFIPQLLASNKDTTNVSASATADLSDSQSIINNINLGATTGNANVINNTEAGNATTSNANTNLTLLNLTGRQIDAKNSLLVFVNVLGTWVGMIVDAPAGATAAALGNGVTNNNVNFDQSLNADTNSTITNNINLAAASGDATVANNTQAGNATTGNATASANIANISTSTFNITDWFGILFINVLGSWFGSFGVDTASGKIIPIGGDALPANADSPDLRVGFAPKAESTKRLTPTKSWQQREAYNAPLPLINESSETSESNVPVAVAGIKSNGSSSNGGTGSALTTSASTTSAGIIPNRLALSLLIASLIGTAGIALFRLIRQRLTFA